MEFYGKHPPTKSLRGPEAERGAAALIMVLIVLTILSMIGAPFVISMALQDRASLSFAGAVVARQAADSARTHAVAHLETTVYGVEFEEEAALLEEEYPRGLLDSDPRTFGQSLRSARRRASSGPGMVVRRDRGETFTRREQVDRRQGRTGESGDPASLPESLRSSRKGPSSRDVDAPEETDVPPLGKVVPPPGLEGRPESRAATGLRSRTAVGSSSEAFDFRDPRGVMADAAVADEQGKIHLNTAPPNLIANLFGVGQLAAPLDPRQTQIVLEDSSMFPGDADASTLDGAIVIGETGEAITYRSNVNNVLGGCLRNAFFSFMPGREVVKAGALVYSLKGWKVGYHRIWAQREGGFHPRELTRFHSIEEMRNVAGWQAASLFLTRFRGEGFTAEFLRESGVNLSKLARLGLDPYLFADDDLETDAELRDQYEAARRWLRRLRFPDSLVKRLRARRGARVVIDLAASLEKADRQHVERVRQELLASLDADQRRVAKFPREYMTAVLSDISDAYRTPGIETILPEDLEAVRDAVTVYSRVPVEWSEAQSLLSDMPLTEDTPTFQIPRANELNAGTIVRLRSLTDPSYVEYNEAAASSRGGGGAAGGVGLAWPPRRSLKAYDGLIEALQRHPVNVNTASRRVLRAVFTGVQGYGQDESGRDQVVSPYEADRLAERVLASVPIAGHEAFYQLLRSAAEADIIGDEDFQPLLINAISPTHPSLRVSTTGFCYSSADIYTIESRGLVRSASGSEIARATFRDVVDVSAPRPLSVGLITQADLADGIHLREPSASIGFPESHRQFLLGFSGTLSHLVMSRPLLLHRVPLAFPGGEVGNLRLFPSETPDPRWGGGGGGAGAGGGRGVPGTVFVEHFPNTYEGYELAHGEPWYRDIGLGQGGQAAGGPAVGAGALGAAVGALGAGGGGGGIQDLTTAPGGVELWLRMRTYPQAQDGEGNMILFDAGAEPDRNRISLLYSDMSGQLRLRIYDASLPDPSVLKTRDTGQYLEVTAARPLELETWYHLRALWDGVYGGGAQLLVDGIPIGTDNLSTELVSSIPEAGSVAAISVRDASKFPNEGVVRIDAELFEYIRSGNSLQIRRQPPAHFVPLPEKVNDATGRGRDGEPIVTDPGAAAGAAAPGVSTASLLMRSPYNRRGGMASVHRSGARVSLHGYSLRIRRKIEAGASGPAQLQGLARGLEMQASEGTNDIVWGRGGRRLAEPLLAFNFPPGIHRIEHYVDFGPLRQAMAQAGQQGTPLPEGMNPGETVPGDEEIGGYVVPLFRRDGTDRREENIFTADLPNAPRNAIDYFQSRGVCGVGGTEYLYERVPLPNIYTVAQRVDPKVDAAHVQTIGLRIIGPYPPGSGGARPGSLPGGNLGAVIPGGIPGAGNAAAGAAGANVIRLSNYQAVYQYSMLLDGPPLGLYPSMGIVEIGGAPTPWEQALGRIDVSGQPLFQVHPDDAVEWLRYREIYESLLVGRFGGAGSNFRGYPERRTRFKKQLDHPPGAPVRLVMELSEGGAGFGDYVSIATRDPQVFEPQPRRVYKVLEHEDGRFFVSLLPVGRSGRDLANVPDVYQHSYTPAMYPRLVKFPTWNLPEIGTGQAVFFGNALMPTAGAGRSNLAGLRENEYEDRTGITLDEVRGVQTTATRGSAAGGTSLQYVVVPLEGGAVRFSQGGPGGATISGLIPAEQMISPSNPMEILVVSVSTEPGHPTLFARGLEEGLLRIGDEVFYFEGPQPEPGSGRLGGGQQNVRQAVPAGLDDARRERDDLARNTVFPQIPVDQLDGHFEREGFARLEDHHPERSGFFETFYYRSLQGGFAQCLRGQFMTPIAQNTSQYTITSCTRRLRLLGRGLLGSERRPHGLGDPCALVPLTVFPITGPLTDTGISVKRAGQYSRSGGYLLMDSGLPGVPWEIVAHLGPRGEGMLARPRDEGGRGILRSCFGTPMVPISNQVFAYEMPYRYPDRYQEEVDSESLAFLQKSFRVPGATWRSIQWAERQGRSLRERRCDVVVAARFDGEPEWSAKPTHEPGGLYLFEEPQRRSNRGPSVFELNRKADQLEVRIYFRYPAGSFTRLPGNLLTDDWKETPVLEYLTVEYEKGGSVLRHEELPF